MLARSSTALLASVQERVIKIPTNARNSRCNYPSHQREFQLRQAVTSEPDQAWLKDSESDHFQPHNRQGFASRGFAKPHCLACRMGEQAVSGEFVNWLIPRNLRKRRLLQVSDLYRGFESFPLRHAVCTAEKVGPSTSEIRENCP